MTTTGINLIILLIGILLIIFTIKTDNQTVPRKDIIFFLWLAVWVFLIN